MKRSYLVLIAIAALVAACQPSKVKERELPFGDANFSHLSNNCPIWEGNYDSDSSQRSKRVRHQFDKLGSYILVDGESTWVINGKPQFMSGEPGMTYVGACIENNKVSIQVYQDEEKFFRVDYAGSGKEAFEHSVVNNNGFVEQAKETYQLNTSSVESRRSRRNR